MVSLGMPAFTVDDFHSNFLERLDNLQDEDVLETLNDQGGSDYIVVFWRWALLLLLVYVTVRRVQIG